MRRILVLYRKDLLRRWRSPVAVLALAAFPLIFSGMLALAFGGSGNATPKARLLLEDRDGSLAGGLIKNFLNAEQLSDFLEVEEVGAEGRDRIEKGEASALLIVPEETTSQLAAGKAVHLELVRNPAQGILPEIAEQVTAILADVLSILTGLLLQQVDGLDLNDVTLKDLGDLADEDFARLAVSFRRTFEEVGTFVNTPPIAVETAILGEEEETQETESSRGINVFLFVLPGIAVFALFLTGDQMMRDVLVETRLGTLARQLTAPVTAGQLILAKVLTTATVGGLVLLILAAIAGALSTAPVSFGAFSALSISLVLAITGFAALIYSLVRTENQGSTIASLVYLAMGFTGGSFMPLDDLPPALLSMAPANPFYWGTRGFQKLLDGGGFGDVAASVGVLGGLGLIGLGLGTFFLQRKVLRGDVR